jgi:hypothetical protein
MMKTKKIKMKAKVLVDGLVITNRQDIQKFFKAIEETGLEINYSAVAKKLKLPVTTVFCVWAKFKEINNIDILLTIKGR